jgi:circadian clock protein KaiB
MRADRFKFRLYVAGDTVNSAQAVANLNALCHEHLLDRHEIEVVDVLREPKRALVDSIFMTPALIRLVPFPIRKIIGTLSQTGAVIETMGLKAVAA